MNDIEERWAVDYLKKKFITYSSHVHLPAESLILEVVKKIWDEAEKSRDEENMKQKYNWKRFLLMFSIGFGFGTCCFIFAFILGVIKFR